MLFYNVRRLCIYKAVFMCSTMSNVAVVQVKYRSIRYQVSSMAILVFTCGPLSSLTQESTHI